MNNLVALYLDPAFHAHGTGPMHPESPGRMEVAERAFENLPAEGFLRIDAAPEATLEEIARIHDETYIEQVREFCKMGPASLDPDTHVTPESWEAALKAAGAGMDAARRVLGGEFRRAFCAVRPPGHHAERDRAMGFCLFNNVAITAAALRAEGLQRVAIVDFDAHHGNGTQHGFWDDPSILYASCHQHPFYPGTGGREETGGPLALGATLNRPFPAGAGDEEFINWHEGELSEALREFRPQFILVSAGFDAHEDDPMVGLRMSTDGYGRLGRILADLADELCEGRLVSILEGGYHPRALPESMVAYLKELAR